MHDNHEQWDLKQLGWWGFIKKLYAHHKPSGGALILRIGLALVFISEGWMKLSGFAGTVKFFGMLGFGGPAAWACLVAWTEIIAGLLILVGLLTKPACVALAVEMAVIIWVLPNQHGGFLWGHPYEFFLLLTLLAMYIMGPGKYSLAHLWLKGKGRSAE